MSKLFSWFYSQDRNELTYWLGLLMLFVGLALGVSIETALTVVGAAIASESVVTSYLAAWIGARK